MDEMDTIFKLATCPSLLSLLFLRYFRFYEQSRALVMGLDGIGVIFKLSALDELDDVINLNQSIWLLLIPQGFFSGIVIWEVGSIEL